MMQPGREALRRLRDWSFVGVAVGLVVTACGGSEFATGDSTSGAGSSGGASTESDASTSGSGAHAGSGGRSGSGGKPTGSGANTGDGGHTTSSGGDSGDGGDGGMAGDGGETGDGGSATTLDGSVGGGTTDAGAGGASTGGSPGTGGLTATGGTIGAGGAVTCSDPGMWYPDNDHDGYGVTSEGVRNCSQPDDNWVVLGGDCNDAHELVHPNPDPQSPFYPQSYGTVNGGTSFDYDCSGVEEAKSGQGGVEPVCAGLLVCSGSGWVKTSRTGTGVNPLCGSVAHVVCANSGLGCTKVTTLVTVDNAFACR